MRQIYVPNPTKPHEQVTPPALGGAASSAAPPQAASGMILQVSTQDAHITFDGSTPTAANGLRLVKDTAPVFLPLVASLKILGALAGAVVNIVWVTD